MTATTYRQRVSFAGIVFALIVAALVFPRINHAQARFLTAITVTPANPTVSVGQLETFAGQGIFNDASAEIVGAGGGTWAASGPMNAARFYHTATLLQDGTVLVVGGYDGTTTLASAERYFPASGTWVSAGSMSTARLSHSATLLPNGKVLVAGGIRYPDNTQFNTTELYDPMTNSWSAGPSLTLGVRSSHSAVLLGTGKVLVTAGLQSYPDCTYRATSELYDPLANTWAATGSLHLARSNATTALLADGKVLLAGGPANGCPSPNLGVSEVEVYDPASAAWTVTGALTLPRYSNSITLLPSGKVLLASGFANGGVSPSSDVYNPATGSFSLTGLMNTARVAAGGVGDNGAIPLLYNGQVLYAGGTNNVGNVLGSAELYNPATGAWTPTASLATPRTYHTTTLLQDGRVLVAGGFGAAALASAEVYLPKVTWSSSNPSVARVDQTGVATALSLGTTTITVTFGSISGSTLLTVAADTVPPTTSASFPAPNANGWNQSNVGVNLSAVDSGGIVSPSGVRSITYALTGAQTGGATFNTDNTSFTISNEGTTTVTYFATDNKGNVEASHTLTIKLDKTPPTLTALPDISASATSASGAVVTFTPTATDSLSGIDTVLVTQGLPSGSTFPHGTTIEQVTVTDRAGNTTAQSFNVTVNKALVSIAVSPSSATLTAAENSQQFTATKTYTDGSTEVGGALSWTSSNGSVATVDQSGVATAAASGTATIAATSGSISGIASVTVDAVRPATTATQSPAANGAGWNNTDVTVTLHATDDTGGSGVQAIVYSVNSGVPLTVAGNTATVAISNEGSNGVTTVSYQAIDNIGNVEAGHILTIKLDKTPPTLPALPNISTSATSSAGASVTFPASGSDGLSGLAGPVTVSPLASGDTFPLGTTHETVAASDAAGNTATASFDVVVNSKRPSLNVTGGTFVADGNPHPATGTATDVATSAPVAGTFTFVYTPTAPSGPVAPGQYSAAGSFVSADPTYTSVNPWTTQAADVARQGATSGVLNNQLYVVGGYPYGDPTAASPVLSRNAVYDTVSNSWTTKANPLTPRSLAGAGVINNKLYVAGGCVNADCDATPTAALEVYDPATDSWASLAAMPTVRNSMAVGAIDGLLYVAGGGAPLDPTGVLEVYDPVSNAWDTTRAPMPVPVTGAAAAVSNGKLYVIGGTDAAGPTGRVQVYDPASNSWSGSGATLPTDTTNATAVAANNLIYVFGGSNGAGILSNVWSYDPNANAWAGELALPTPRFALAAGFINGSIYAVGGSSAASVVTGVNEQLFLPLTAHITIEAPLTPPTMTATPPTALSGQAIAIGGNGAPNASIALFDGLNPSGVVSADAGGNWTTSRTFIVGSHTLTATQSSGDQTSGASAAVTVHVRPPAPGISSPSSATSTTSPASVLLSGFGFFGDDQTPPAGSTVTIFENQTSLGSAVVASGGQWSTTVLLGTGSHALRASQTLAGETSDLSPSFTVTVNSALDTTPPTLTLPSSRTKEATSASGAVITFPNATATDSGSGVRSVSCDRQSGATFPLGATTVHCSAVDNSGNTASGSFKLTVVDTTPPKLTLPAAITVDATSPAGVVVTYTKSAMDVVSGAVAVTCLPSSGSTFPIGRSTVVCSARDGAGNIATGKFRVFVHGAAPQVAKLIAMMRNLHLVQNLAYVLDAKLQSILNALHAERRGHGASVCGQLDGFIDETRAQSGRKLTAAQANELVAAATRIERVVGCR